jgi:hypothetical protein
MSWFSRRFFGGLISMIVISSISLSTMLSNNLLIPYGFIGLLENASTVSGFLKAEK